MDMTNAQFDERYDRIARRDASADGAFVYAVRTTGVYCRPSCGARLARPENVSFHATPADAEAAGFRPCKRCRPNEAPRDTARARLIAEACRAIEEADTLPSLDDLAAAAGLSPFHFHRQFKAITGLTPKAYATAHRARRVKGGLAAGDSITGALYDAGFGSSSRFYEKSSALLGMTPSAYRDGGRDAEILFAVGQCTLGAILVAATERGVAAIELGPDPQALVEGLQDRFPKARLTGGDERFEALVAQVVGLVESPGRGHDLPLDVRGTAFQQRVWQELRRIPPGTTASYADVATAIGQPSAVRAVAKACATNVLAVAIPCHRVVRSDGALSGYRWGIERKAELLRRESARAG
jgi:AraC family transcriptional regulator of adaptative response/methylated-DNA-[protein]-cysteine methyltransferase